MVDDINVEQIRMLRALARDAENELMTSNELYPATAYDRMGLFQTMVRALTLHPSSVRLAAAEFDSVKWWATRLAHTGNLILDS